MLTPETILAEICRLADNEHAEFAAWALDKLLEDHPDHAATHNNRAVLAYKQGDQTCALKHYERAAALAPESVRFHKDLGNFLILQQQPETALHRFEHVLSLKDDDIEALMAAGHLSVSLLRLEDARRYYQCVLAKEPENAEARMFSEKIGAPEPNTSATADELYAAALEKASSGLTDDAMELLLQLMARDKNNATAHNDLGVLFYCKGNMGQALYHYEKAASLVPENSIFQKNLADFYWIEKGDVEAALELYVRVLNLDPRDVEALLCCGSICMQLQKVEDARLFFESVLKNDPWNEDARQLLHQLDAHAGTSETSWDTATPKQPALNMPVQDGNRSAIDELEQMLALDPHNAEAYNDLGVLCYQQGNKRKALDCYEKAVQITPCHPIYQKNLADFYLIEEGRIKDALKLYVKVLEANPEDVECMLATGFICLKMNNLDEARSFYERALEIEPWNADVRQALSQLDLMSSYDANRVNDYAAG